MAPHQWVSMTPGETAFTRSGASSTASGATIVSSAPLTAASPAVPANAARADAAVTRVTEPSWRRCGSAAWSAFTWAKNLPSKAWRSAASSRVAIGPTPTAPGLAHSTKWSIVPVAAKKASSASRLVASSSATWTGWPIRCAAWSRRSLDRPVMVTSAPLAAKSLAAASPIPALAPMITTRCPSNDMVYSPSFVETDRLFKPYRYCESRQIGRLPGMDDGPRRPHTGRRRNDAAQEAILDAAFRLLSDPGSEAVTIDAIAAEAGVGRQTIYRWWPSKGAVVADALVRHARVVVPERDTGSFTGDLTAFFIDSFAGLENEGYADRLRQIVTEAQHDEHVARVLADFTAVRRAALRALLEQGRDTGELAADADLDMLVDMAYGVLYYRLLIGHAPLDEKAARTLAAELARPSGKH